MRSVLLVEDDDKLRNSFARAIAASGDFRSWPPCRASWLQRPHSICTNRMLR